MDFNKLNSHLYDVSAPHKFAKKPNQYDKGYMKISNWLNDLCYHFEKKRQDQELSDEDEFKSIIEEHREKINQLDDSDFKNGLLKALSEV